MWCKLQKGSSQLIIEQKCVRKHAECLIKLGVFPLLAFPCWSFPFRCSITLYSYSSHQCRAAGDPDMSRFVSSGVPVGSGGAKHDARSQEDELKMREHVWGGWTN